MVKKISPVLLSVPLVLALPACKKPAMQVHQSEFLVGLATPVQLEPDITLIHLRDYFPEPQVIDSLTIPEPFSFDRPEDHIIRLQAETKDFPFLNEMKVWVEGIPYSILLKRSPKKRVTFVYRPRGKMPAEVELAGQMNGWNPSATPMEFRDGRFEKELWLNPGRYQYQLVVNGKWMLDPANPDSVSNNLGGFNSVMKVGACEEESRPVIRTSTVGAGGFTLGLMGNPDELDVFWQNYRLDSGLYDIEGEKATIRIPEAAKNMKRSFIRVWAANDSGISNDVLVPLDHGDVITDTASLTTDDWETASLYFLMVDRFNNGDPDNDRKVDDPEILPMANYFGGDLAGVIEKIRDGYFRKLGVNTIWLSPITQNPLGAYGLWPDPRSKFSGYHGYWPISSTRVDFRFGTDKELQELVDLAHEHGLNVILDYVANHVHENHPVYQKHPDWATDLYLPDGTLNTEKWDEQRLTTWFDTFLPTLDLSKPEVVEVMTDSALYWLENFGIDGFRHDATKHIPEVFWRTLTQKIKNRVVVPADKRIYQIGETYGSPELISSYVSSGMLDGQFDFNTYDRAISVFAGQSGESFRSLNDALMESLQVYGYHNLMGYITGNQDRARFISYAGGALSFGEDAKLAGWTREIGVGDTTAYKKLRMLLAFISTIPGIPTIYYGDEFGMPGGNDPDNRRMMRFEDLNGDEKATRDITRKLMHVRSGNMALMYGFFETVDAGEDVYVYSRSYFDRVVFVAFNKGNTEQKITVPLAGYEPGKLESHFGSDVMAGTGVVELTLKPLSFEILTN